MNLTPQCWNTQTSPLADSRIGQLRVLRSCSFCWCHMFNQSPWSHKFLVHVPKTYRNQNPQESMWRSSKDWPKRSGCTFLFLFGIGQNKNLNYQLIAPAVLQEILSRPIAWPLSDLFCQFHQWSNVHFWGSSIACHLLLYAMLNKDSEYWTVSSHLHTQWTW